MEHVQELASDGVVVGLDFDPAAVVAEVVPVEKHRAEGGQQPVGDVTRAGDRVIVALGQNRAQRRAAGPHHIHGVSGGRNLFQHRLHWSGESAQRTELLSIVVELVLGWQLPVNEKVRDFLERRLLRELQNVIAAVMEIVAGASHGADLGVAGDYPGQGNPQFFPFRRRCQGVAHDGFSFANS